MAPKRTHRRRRAATGTIVGLLGSLVLGGMIAIGSETASWSALRSSARAMEMATAPGGQVTSVATLPVGTTFPTVAPPVETTTAAVTPTGVPSPRPTTMATPVGTATETPLAPTATAAPTPAPSETPTETSTSNIGLSETTVDCKGVGCSGRCYFQNRIELTCDKDKKITAFSLTYPKGTTNPECCTFDRSNGRGKFLVKTDDGTWYSYTGNKDNPGTKEQPKPLSDIFDVSKPTVEIKLKPGNKVVEAELEIQADLKCKCKDGTETKGTMKVRITIKDCSVTVSPL